MEGNGFEGPFNFRVEGVKKKTRKKYHILLSSSSSDECSYWRLQAAKNLQESDEGSDWDTLSYCLVAGHSLQGHIM